MLTVLWEIFVLIMVVQKRERQTEKKRGENEMEKMKGLKRMTKERGRKKKYCQIKACPEDTKTGLNTRTASP